MIRPGVEAGIASPSVNVNILGSNPKDNGDISFGDMVSLFNDATEVSLPSFVKSTQISSTVYIQNSCIQEEILTDVLQCAQQLYISWILAAVNLNSVIGSTRTKVKDALKVVATEEMTNSLNQLHVPTEDIIAGIENFGMFSSESTTTTNTSSNKHTGVSVSGNNKEIIKSINTTVSLPVSRVIELKVGVDGSHTYTVNALVNLYPQIIPDHVFREYVKLGHKASLAERWFKVRTGEYKFWKDFIFEIGDAEKRAKAIKKDHTGLLQDMIEREQSGFSKIIRNIFNSIVGFAYNNPSQTSNNRKNIANSVLVFNKADFNRWTKEINLNFNIERDRNTFMSKTLSMMVIVIDSDFQMVEMYYNGIRNKGEFTFKQIQSQSKSEKYDLAYLMKAFSTVNSPKF